MANAASTKFIPDRDGAFAIAASRFARAIGCDPARFGVADGDARRVGEAVDAFVAAFKVTQAPRTNNEITRLERDEARREAEGVMRQIGNFIRANPQVNQADKLGLNLRPRPTRLSSRSCPQGPPVLKFLRSEAESDRTRGVHILHFGQGIGTPTKTKPPGATRIELFFGLVRPGSPVPRAPYQTAVGWPMYLRSFSKSPMRVEFPFPPVPMLVVYWGRWANEKGEFGSWSQTAVARIEGGMIGQAGAAGVLEDAAEVRRVIVETALRELAVEDRSGERAAQLTDESDKSRQAA